MISEFKGSYRFLSNFWPAEVRDPEGLPLMYPSVEHAYQACKTLSKGTRTRIASLPTAGDAKRAGKSIVLREDWDTVKVGIMRALVRQKFDAGSLRTSLLSTGEEELQEGNRWGDTFWGVCGGKGLNWLGRILMETRDILKGRKVVLGADGGYTSWTPPPSMGCYEEEDEIGIRDSRRPRTVTVVNIRDLPGYPAVKLERWQVYVGRANSYVGMEESPLHNLPEFSRLGREGSIAEFKTHFHACLEEPQPIFGSPEQAVQKEIHRLEKIWGDYGKLELVCWCAPKACHGQVIKAYLEAN